MNIMEKIEKESWDRMKKDKCPKCKCNKVKKMMWYHDGQYFLEEKTIKCNQCGNLKFHWAYGDILVDDWKDLTSPSLWQRIKWKTLERKNKNLPY